MAPGSLYNQSSPLPPIGTPVRPATNSTILPPNTTAIQTTSLLHRAELLKQNDEAKNTFINELIIRFDFLSQEHDRVLNARAPEQDALRNWQIEKQEYERQLSHYNSALQRNPFVVVLIDGDGMIFENDFLREGELGGRKAAARLQKEIENHIQHETKNIPVEARIICRIYANVKGLADVLVRAGVIEEIAVFEDFVRGFTRGKTLFDFVDVGPGKDRADDKVIESFKIYANDFHCRQIFFGCSHDNGFARTLEEHMTDNVYLSKVTLLEGVPFEKELLVLPYDTKKFQGVFRQTKINLTNAWSFGHGHTASPALDAPKTYNIITGLPSRLPPPSRPTSGGGSTGNQSFMDSPIVPKVDPVLPRTPSSSTLASDGVAAAVRPVSAMNWAAKAAAPPPPSTEFPKYAPANREEVIARNRSGQRVDPQTRDYDKTEVDRVKKIKMCNVHFLRRECPYGGQCTHLHSYDPSASELSTLRLVARMAPCQNGSSCQDIKCIYGHRCPAPASKRGTKGSKTCIFGDTCKFPPELHDLDCNVVKTLVIR